MSQKNQYDFIISSDVLEHVVPPISKAFENIYQLLKPGGIFIFTVPYVTDQKETIEHFPDLHQYEIFQEEEKFVLKNTTQSGEIEIFEDLIFHGGEGSTLEMRVFTESDLLKHFQRVGFGEVQIHKEEYLKYGIYWKDSWALPISAHKKS